MKNSTGLSLIFSLLLGCLLASCQPMSPCVLSDEDQAYFRTEIANSQETWNSGDREGYGNRYADNAVFMIPNSEALTGKKNIQAWLKTLPEIKVQFGVTEILGSCQLAAVRGTFQMTVPDGTVVDKGKWLEIWQKVEDGQWELTRDIFNSDMPLSAPPEADGTTPTE